MTDARREPAANGNKILAFSGDEEEEEEEDPAVDLFAEVSKSDADVEDEAEPEDDVNAACEILDLACAIYEKRMDGDDAMRLIAADTFIILGAYRLRRVRFCRAPAFALNCEMCCGRETRARDRGLQCWSRAQDGAPPALVAPVRRGALQAQYRARPYRWPARRPPSTTQNGPSSA